ASPEVKTKAAGSWEQYLAIVSYFEKDLTKFITVWSGHHSVRGIVIGNEVDYQLRNQLQPEAIYFMLARLAIVAKADMQKLGSTIPIGVGLGAPQDSRAFAFLQAADAVDFAAFNLFEAGTIEQVASTVRTMNASRSRPLALIFTEIGNTGAQLAAMPPA